MKDLIKKLSSIQAKIKVPKDQDNDFRGFKFRHCEDILQKVKEFLDDETMITLSDEYCFLEGNFFIKTTVTFYHKDKSISVTGVAREENAKKGFDAPQLTGTAASYAAKRSLGNLFCIDNEKDPDSNAYQKQCRDAENRDRKQNNNNNNKQKQNNNNNQNHKNSRDKVSSDLKSEIFKLTDGFKDNVKISVICTDLGVKDISEIAYRDDSQKREMIEFLRNKKY